MSQPKKLCIFCGEGKISDEHFYPQWMHPLLPKNGKEYHFSTSYGGEYIAGEKIESDIVDKEHQGPYHTYKLRIVCRSCNSGWMGKIEEKAIAPLTDLILGNSVTLNKEQVARVAAWLALRTIIGEYRYSTVSIPKEDYEYIKITGLAPPHWHIWIGSHKVERWKIACTTKQIAGCISTDFDKPGFTPPDDYNTCTTSFGYGELFAHVSVSAVKGLLDEHDSIIHDMRSTFGRRLLARVWPVEAPVIWPAVHSLTDAQMDTFRQSLALTSGKPPQEFLNSQRKTP